MSKSETFIKENSMTDNHKNNANSHGNIGKLVQIGKVEGGVTIQSTLESNACCPICERNDEVKKVSAILAKEIHSMNGMTIEKSSYQDKDGKWHTSTERVPFSGTQSTVLAMKLKAPAQPKAKGKPSFWLLLFSIILGFYGFAALFLGPDRIIEDWAFEPDIIHILGIGMSILCGIFLLYWSFTLYKKNKKNQEIYQMEVKRIQAQEYPKWQKQWKDGRNYIIAPGTIVFSFLVKTPSQS